MTNGKCGPNVKSKSFQTLLEIIYLASRKSYLTLRRYIDDVLSLNNLKFNDYIYVICPKELEIKDTTDVPKWANYLDHLELDEDGKLFTRLEKCDDFDFLIANFPYLSSNNPESPAYGVFCLTVNTLRSCWFKI